MTFAARSLDSIERHADDVAVSSHACGALTDLVIDRAIAARARVLDAILDGEMASTPAPETIRTFRSQAAFESWLRKNHADASEVWLRIYRTDSGVQSITLAEALDVVLCWGWIDGLRKGFDERSYLQRYTPRRAKSLWSQINREHVARLVKAGRMTPHGQRQVDAAKADGRWAAAYAPMRAALDKDFPADLRAAIERSPRARKTFQSMGRQNLYALAFRTNNMKTAEGRAKKIAALVEMLERGETPHPDRR